jgi:phage repressor protein C with HTH and peptisase S24 domain
MKIAELLDLIRKKTLENVNQSIISKALGVTRQSVNNRIRNNSEITISELQKIEEFFGISLLTNRDTVSIDYYPEVFASCGNGLITFSEEKERLEFHKSFFNNYSPSKKYSMIHAKGDSMSPYINNGDKLIIEHQDNNTIVDNKVYVFCYGTEIFTKRLSKNLDEILIKSENENYGLKTIRGEDMNEIRIIGQVVGIVRTI